MAQAKRTREREIMALGKDIQTVLMGKGTKQN
jgi:hypothetical protein